MNFSTTRILVKHCLPNALPAVLAIAPFIFIGTITIEVSLSIVGLNFNFNYLNWSTLLSQIIEYPSAWWIAFFPGFAIFLLSYAFYKINNTLSKI